MLPDEKMLRDVCKQLLKSFANVTVRYSFYGSKPMPEVWIENPFGDLQLADQLNFEVINNCDPNNPIVVQKSRAKGKMMRLVAVPQRVKSRVDPKWYLSNCCDQQSCECSH